MTAYVHAALIVAASIVLIQAVKLFIKSATKIARELGISGYTISFLLVAVATSLPEVVVGVTSALQNNATLSFGNAVGSNIALLTLVVAIPVLIGTEKGMSTRTILHSHDAYYSLFFSLLPISLIVDGSLTRIDGGILLAAYVFYAVVVWRRSKGVERVIETLEKTNLWKQSLIFFFSLILLLGASEMIVRSATQISLLLGLGLTFVGLTITAIGTSLPEIAFTVGASRGRFQQEILGDVIGSVVANSTLVLGITSVISPIVISNGGISFSALMLATFIMVTFLRFVKTKEKIDKLEAMILMTLYIVFIVSEYILSTVIL